MKRCIVHFIFVYVRILHFSQYTLPLIASGLIFCWLYHKTGKIVNNMIVHSSYNITLLLLIHFLCEWRL
ncbi:CPBP family intramembrane metalloprotease [Staphylococcus pseudintermedius]|nr:CPBP family intramembrane metalloprotease [Staphylococcus pseudintermedius]